VALKSVSKTYLADLHPPSISTVAFINTNSSLTVEVQMKEWYTKHSKIPNTVGHCNYERPQ
jgi:hypothetical protein